MNHIFQFYSRSSGDYYEVLYDEKYLNFQFYSRSSDLKPKQNPQRLFATFNSIVDLHNY